MGSWIDAFVEQTQAIESPAIYRKWSAICAIASVLELKVWLPSGGSFVYPNLYTFLVGNPGVGKTRAVFAVRDYLHEIKDFHIAPTSLTAASLVDALLESKRSIIRLPDEPIEYNSMMIAADELGTFVHKYDDEMIAILSHFYDPRPYGQNRRTKDLKVKVARPQLNILCGTTPSNLLKFLPENAWDQGFMSRIILVFSDEKIVGDDFAGTTTGKSEELVHDLQHINTLIGEFKVTEDYRNLINAWRSTGEQPSPNHPKLIHYGTRRRVHLYKLSMVSAIDRSDVLLLTRDDFNRAMNWLVEAETLMPEIFKAGGGNTDSMAMDEIYHYVRATDLGKGVPEHRIVKFAAERVPAHSVMRVLQLMEQSGTIKSVAVDNRTGTKLWQAVTATLQ